MKHILQMNEQAQRSHPAGSKMAVPTLKPRFSEGWRKVLSPTPC